MFRSAGDRMYQVGSEHDQAVYPPIDAVWVHGKLVQKANLAEFLKSKRCAWRHAFHGGGCE